MKDVYYGIATAFGVVLVGLVVRRVLSMFPLGSRARMLLLTAIPAGLLAFTIWKIRQVAMPADQPSVVALLVGGLVGILLVHRAENEPDDPR